MNLKSKYIQALWGLVLITQLVACGSLGKSTRSSEPSSAIEAKQEVTLRGWSGEHWHHVTFPGKNATLYSIVDNGDGDSLSAVSESSASVMRSTLNRAPSTYRDVSFSWRADALMADADISQRNFDDSPVRVMFAFDGDRSKFSMKNELLSELMRTMSGEEMPYATLIYEWSNTLPAGTIVENPRTDRIKKMVLESGTANLGKWRIHRRNLKADFEKAFGEESGNLIGIAVMTDSDNTRSASKGYYGHVRVLNTIAPPAPAPAP